MLNVIASEALTEQYGDTVTRMFNLVLGHMSRDFRAIFVSISESVETGVVPALLICEIDITPKTGSAFSIKVEGAEPQWVIEHCFVRARRSLLRKKKRYPIHTK